MLAPNIARFLEGELDREVRGNVVAHPLTPGALRRPASYLTRPETHSAPAVAETKKADAPKAHGASARVAPKPDGTSARVRAESKAFWRGFLTSAAVLIAVPSMLLVQSQSQHKESTAVPAHAGLPAGTGDTLSNSAKPLSKSPEIVLTSPHKLEAKAGEEIGFAIAIDATEALPARSLVAISAMPEGASFSEGRPYGMTGWSLRPDEIGELRLLLPKTETGSYDMSIELLAGDGSLLAQSETRLKISYDLETLGTSADSSEITSFAESFAPPPQGRDSFGEH